jgi:TonB family protein
MLLMGGSVMAALMPWNPVVWWLTWRLRVAVELDCDRRVLAANPAVRQYVDLLLLAAGRNRLSARLLAAHFGEYTSDLERRICAMTDSRVKLRPVLVALATSAVLLAAACEAPRPDPVAPGLSPVVTPESRPLIEERRVAPAIAIAEGSRYPRYPAILLEAGVEGRVVVSFVVTEAGVADVASLKLLETTHDLFAVAVREALPDMRFTATSGKSKLVPQRVEQPLTFMVVGDGPVEREVLARSRPGALADIVVRGVARGSNVLEPKARPSGEPTIVLRRARTLGVGVRPNILVRSIAGEELRRYLADSSKEPFKSPLGEIDPQDIEAIEVLKGRAACPAPAPPCPLITVTVKRGREAAYRAR